MSAFRFNNPTGTLPIEGGVSLAPGVTVPNWGLRFRFSRSSGPGGQNVNKVNTKAEAWLRVDAIHGMRAADLERLRQQADRFITQTNELHVTSESTRSQDANRQDVLRKIRELIIKAMIEPKVRKATKPVIVAGDFNTFWGEHEIYLFMRASGLKSANAEGMPSFPSRSPRKELDFVLYSDGIQITHFAVPDVRFSDHRPLVCDFEVARVPA